MNEWELEGHGASDDAVWHGMQLACSWKGTDRALKQNNMINLHIEMFLFNPEIKIISNVFQKPKIVKGCVQPSVVKCSRLEPRGKEPDQNRFGGQDKQKVEQRFFLIIESFFLGVCRLPNLDYIYKYSLIGIICTKETN